MKISLSEQVKALESTVANHRGYVTMCERFAATAEFNQDVLADTKARLPLMEACLATMKWLLANEEKIKKALKG